MPTRGRAERERARGRGAPRRRLLLACLLAGCLCAHVPAAHALKAIAITNDLDRIEITALGEAYEGRGDALQIETAPGADGVRGRMSVRAATPGTNPAWFVFALTNTTDKAVERWLAADRYGTVGSGVVWPDLDARRIDAVTPSVGYVPERIKNDRADVFRLTLEPGQTVTFVAELASDRFARLFLWKAIEYEQKSRDRQLFNGIMLGITGLLAIFLTAVFAANHKAIFPTAAIFTWCVLAYLCVDFGFWHKLFNIRPEENAQYRAATEAGMAATLLIFLYTFLRLGAWHGFVRMLLHALGGGAARPRRRGLPRPAAGGHLRAPLQHPHRLGRGRADAVPGACAARTARSRWCRPGCCCWCGCSAPASPSPAGCRATSSSSGSRPGSC